MRTMFQLLEQTLLQGRAAVLVSTVASSGSTPRGAGAHMLITDEGRLRGTIGGGAVEYQCQQTAAQVLQSRRCRMEQFELRQNDVRDLGMICGGTVTVYFHYIPAEDESMLTVCRAAENLFARGEQSWLICDISPDGAGGISLYGLQSGLAGQPVPACVLETPDVRPKQLNAENRRYYIECLISSGRVYLFGGGHVSQALVPVLAGVDFRCVVLEDREEFTRRELFPGVEETRLIDMSRIEESVTITKEDYICIMTRGHKDDCAVQAFAMQSPARYIGVIGSRRKIAGVTAALKEQYGFRDEEFCRVTTPIGLDIGGETPAEIAISIAAQFIAVRAGIGREARNRNYGEIGSKTNG